MTAYRIKSLAERWDCSPDTVRAMIKRGELKPLPFCGRLLRVSEGEVLRWEAEGKAGSAGTGDDGTSSSTSKAADAARRSARLIAQLPRQPLPNGVERIPFRRPEDR